MKLDKAKEILHAIPGDPVCGDNCLLLTEELRRIKRIDYTPKDKYARLEGNFDLDELRAIVCWMEKAKLLEDY